MYLREHKQEGERERETQANSLLRAEPQYRARSHKPWDHNTNRNQDQTLNQMHHPGAPVLITFLYISMISYCKKLQFLLCWMRTLLGKEVFWAHTQTAKTMTEEHSSQPRMSLFLILQIYQLTVVPRRCVNQSPMEGAVISLPVLDSFLSLPKWLTSTVLPGSLPK